MNCPGCTLWLRSDDIGYGVCWRCLSPIDSVATEVEEVEAAVEAVDLAVELVDDEVVECEKPPVLGPLCVREAPPILVDVERQCVCGETFAATGKWRRSKYAPGHRGCADAVERDVQHRRYRERKVS